MYFYEQHQDSFNIWSATIRINTEGKSLIIKSSPGQVNVSKVSMGKTLGYTC